MFIWKYMTDRELSITRDEGIIVWGQGLNLLVIDNTRNSRLIIWLGAEFVYGGSTKITLYGSIHVNKSVNIRVFKAVQTYIVESRRFIRP